MFRMPASLLRTLSLTVLLLGAAAFVSPTPASASLIGDSVDCSITPTPFWVCIPTTAVVGAGAEFDLFLTPTARTFFEVDLHAFSVDLNFVATGALVLGAGEFLSLTGLDQVFITGFTLSTSGAVTEFTSSDITFTPHALGITLDGSTWQPGSSATISLETQAIPEPATLSLFSLGLYAVYRSRRATRKRFDDF